MAITLTVGDVAGVIAAGIFVLRFILPNALILVLVGILRNQYTSVTWSVVQRELMGSLWPTILRSDAAASRGVNTRIKLFTYLRPLLLALIAVASIVTPLGLYQDVLPDDDVHYVPMRYVPDLGPMRYGMPPRSEHGFSRSCGDFEPLQCPGTNAIIHYDVLNTTGGTTFVDNATVEGSYDMRIPEVLAELYQSGLSDQQPSVSSFFDIQTRQYSYGHSNQKKPYLVDAFRYLTSVVLDNAIEPFEGLVVDTVNGGIGFRNHTAPVTSDLGAEWYEDLLWIEPETVCANTNLSLEMTVPEEDFSRFDLNDIHLVDDGGFANIDQHFPICDVVHTQKDPQLQCRAHRAAWMTNVYTMLIMNLTRPGPGAFGYLKSRVGSRYPLTPLQTDGANLMGIYIDGSFEGLLSPSPPSNYSLANSPGTNYSNPFNIQIDNFTDIAVLCQGAGGMDYTNMTNIMVKCGLLFGASTRKDGSQTLIYEPGIVYKQPIYACASTNKASIKNVHFRYNATNETGHSLKALSVLDVQPKTYPDKESMPIWGIETVPFALHELQQLWGLISPEKQHAVNLSTIQQEHLYLPGYGGTLDTAIHGFDYVPGYSGPTDVLSGVYSTGGPSGIDYSGETNMAMYVRWREMSQNETTVPKVLNLIWTDIAANLMVGTRGWNTGDALPPNLQKRDDDPSSGSSDQPLVPITLYRQRVRYHWYFGVPAFLSLALVLLIVTAASFMTLIRRSGPSRIRYYLSHLSSGRLLSSKQYPGECEIEAPTKQWIASVGERPTDLRKQGTASGPGMSPYHEDQQTSYYGTHPVMMVGGYQGALAAPKPPGSPHKGYVMVNAEDQESDEGFGKVRGH